LELVRFQRGHAVLIMLALIIGAITPTHATGLAEETAFLPSCGIAPLSTEEFDSLRHSASETPVDTSGRFPPVALHPEAESASYSVERALGERIEVTIDGVNWSKGGILSVGTDTSGSPKFTDLAEAIGVLYQFSASIRDLDVARAAALFNSAGLRMMCSSGDPFRVGASPAAWVCDDNSQARSVEALPLYVSRAIVLSDGRLMLFVGEGPDLASGQPELDGSIWILSPSESRWVVDAVFGGMWLRTFWPYIPIG
jgi:hypothetical protein